MKRRRGAGEKGTLQPGRWGGFFRSDLGKVAPRGASTGEKSPHTAKTCFTNSLSIGWVVVGGGVRRLQSLDVSCWQTG